MSDNAIIGARKNEPIGGVRRDKSITNRSMPVFKRKADERIAELEAAIDALVDIDMGDEYWVKSEGYEALLAVRHKNIGEG